MSVFDDGNVCQMAAARGVYVCKTGGMVNTPPAVQHTWDVFRIRARVLLHLVRQWCEAMYSVCLGVLCLE